MLALPEAPGPAHGPGPVNSRRLGKQQQALHLTREHSEVLCSIMVTGWQPVH